MVSSAIWNRSPVIRLFLRNNFASESWMEGRCVESFSIGCVHCVVPNATIIKNICQSIHFIQDEWNEKSRRFST